MTDTRIKYSVIVTAVPAIALSSYYIYTKLKNKKALTEHHTEYDGFSSCEVCDEQIDPKPVPVKSRRRWIPFLATASAARKDVSSAN